MELPITDAELNLIITSLPEASTLRGQLETIVKVRDENPNGPYKRILREKHGMVI